MAGVGPAPSPLNTRPPTRAAGWTERGSLHAAAMRIEVPASAATASPATAVLQSAIDRVAADGGGVVLVPPGCFVTGMLRLKDRVRLHLEPGAVLRASRELAHHEPLAESGGNGDGWGRERRSFHLILAQGCRDIAITGQGRLEGDGSAFYAPPKQRPGWPMSHHEDHRRPGALVQIDRCQDVRIADVTLADVANWTLHLHESDRVWVRGVRIDNPPDAPNADGIDITGCRAVMVSDCHIDTCDDAVVLKTLPHGRSCEDVTVTNCVMRTHCAALKLGCGESYQDMRNIAFSNCVVRGSHRAVGIYSTEGGILENVSIENIVCDTRAPLLFARPIHVDLRRRSERSRLGAIRNLRIAGLLAETTGRIVVTAEPGAVLEDVILRDIVLRYPEVEDPAPHAGRVGGSQFSNRSPWARAERAAVVVENARGLWIEGLSVRWPQGPAPEAWRFAEKLANGDHRVFVPADWEPGADAAFAAVSVRNVRGGGLAGRELRGWNGGEPVRRADCDWSGA